MFSHLVIKERSRRALPTLVLSWGRIFLKSHKLGHFGGNEGSRHLSTVSDVEPDAQDTTGFKVAILDSVPNYLGLH
jgi:hypothetical protein